jgi:hypothetical protein
MPRVVSLNKLRGILLLEVTRLPYLLCIVILLLAALQINESGTLKQFFLDRNALG